jgi:hypothetical protein
MVDISHKRSYYKRLTLYFSGEAGGKELQKGRNNRVSCIMVENKDVIA